MKHRSSIFSFDTLLIQNKFSFFGKGVAVIMVLIAFDLLFRWSGVSDKFLLNHPKSETGSFIFLEKLIPNSPKFVFFGDSISMNGILPKTFSNEIGIDEESFVNLSVTSGTPIDALKMYSRNFEKLRKADVVFYSLNAFQFNKNYYERSISNRWRYLMDFTDLKYASGIQESTSFIFSAILSNLTLFRDSYIFSYYAENPGMIFKESIGTVEQDQETGFLFFRDQEERKFQQSTEFIADRHMSDFEFSEKMLRYLEEFYKLCNENGQKLVLVEFTKKEKYTEMMDGKFSQQQNIILDKLNVLISKPDVSYISSKEIDAATDIVDDDYIDYGHLKIKGAKKTTSFLAEYVHQNFQRILDKK